MADPNLVDARPTDVSGRPLALRDVDLDLFLHPKTVAVIGASETPGRPNTQMTKRVKEFTDQHGGTFRHPRGWPAALGRLVAVNGGLELQKPLRQGPTLLSSNAAYSTDAQGVANMQVSPPEWAATESPPHARVSSWRGCL